MQVHTRTDSKSEARETLRTVFSQQLTRNERDLLAAYRAMDHEDAELLFEFAFKRAEKSTPGGRATERSRSFQLIIGKPVAQNQAQKGIGSCIP